jgi:hypothetical protein
MTRLQTPLEREVLRYTAYFRGWCQAFGEHESETCADEAFAWLFGDGQIGLILPRPLTRALYREVLRRHGETPVFTVADDSLEVGAFRYRLPCRFEDHALSALQGMLETPADLHLYLSYHFLYRSGTRIITLSHKKPLHIIYREMSPMRIRIRRRQGPAASGDDRRPERA